MINVVRDVGQRFRARCPDCGFVTRHRTVCNAGESGWAHCDKCGRVLRGRRVEDDGFRGATPPPAAVQPPHRRRVPDGVEQQWHDRVAARDPDDAVAYRSDQVLQVGQLVEHPAFGLGEVRKLIPSSTAEVHFQSGFKRLRCRL